MNNDQAYRFILEELDRFESHTVVRNEFTPEIFGNFVINVSNGREITSFVCDRGQLLVCDGDKANSNCSLLVPFLYKAREEEIRNALARSLTV